MPCLFPQVGQPDAGVIKVASTTPFASEAAFAVTLRALLGRTGEFAFLLGDRSVVWVDGLEEGQTTETLKTYDALDVTGLETVEAKLSFGNEDDTPPLKAPILFHLQVRPSSIALAYSKAHIPDSFARQLVDMYLVENCRGPISQDIVKDFEGLSVLNYPPRPYPSSTQKYTLLHEGFLAQAAMHPEAIAIDFLGAADDVTARQTMTYAELDRRSSALSKFIRHMIPGEEKSIIPLALPPSTALYVGYLGVLRSGHAFCPLPGLDNAPVERIVELVGDVDAPLVLGLGSRPSWMADMSSVAWKDINEIDGDVEGLEGHWPPKETDLAYVLFTSGSTGKPKGVQISHLAVSASIASHLSVRSLPLGTRWFQFAASTFDPSLMEIFMNFSSGTTICAANRERFLTDPEAVLRELKCSHMMATPSMAALLRPEKIGDAFELWTMGEKLSDSVINAFSRPEKATYSATHIYQRDFTRPSAHRIRCSFGRPDPDRNDGDFASDERETYAPWLPGRACLAGVQLANGYLNMPEQTAKAFVQVEGIGRVYRTGDRARVVLDEMNKWSGIEYLGRMGMGQVKLAGRRVELGEIDAVLSAVAGIQAAHTVVLNEQLYTLITPASNELIARAEEVALARLPLHMRPVSYVLANSTPQSAAGKADRRAITKLIESSLAETSKSDDDSLPPADPKTLELVVRLVAEAADIDQRAITPPRDAGVQGLEIQDLLGRATPISVARLITERRGQDSPEKSNAHLQIIEDFIPQAATAVRRELGISGEDALPKILPSTPMQASVLAVYLRTPERSTGYLNHSIYTLSANVQIEPFKKAWEEVVRRNAILRTFFVLVDDSNISPFAQVVNEQPNINWIESTGPDVDALVSRHLDTIPEHISTRTPSAVALFSNEDKTDVRFALTLHHALFDGGSLALMLEELHSIYTASETPLQRAGFEHGIADALNANTEVCTQYWTEELRGQLEINVTAYHFLFTPGSEGSGHHVSTVISSLTFSDMREQARNIHATPLSVIQAAWALILLTYSESESPDIVFGSVIGGRTSESLEFTVGPVFSTVPVRIRNAEKVTTKGVLSGLLEKNVSSLLNRYPPVKVLSGEKGFIYDTTIALQNFGEGLSQTELWTKAEYPPMETEFAIVLEIWVEQNDAIRLRATCSNNVLIPSASEDMLRQFDNLISGILSSDYHDGLFLNLAAAVDPSLQSSVNRVPLPRAIPSDQLIHHEFEDNCQRNPDSLALWFKHDLEHPECDVKWTYRELNTRANRLAHYLVNTFGDVRDQAIPLCMEKCPELYVAILGIVKAGAAWCPVDAEAPEKRQKDLFSRAGGPVILVRDTSALATYEGARPENLVMLALDDPRLSDQPDSNPVVDISPSHLAYLIWTSGTTGLPKGVPIEHKAAAQSLSALQEAIPFHNSGVRCLNFSAYIFDVSVLDVFYALGASCGTLCSSPKDVLLNQFVDVVNAFEATHAFLTPAFMAQSSLSECNTLQSLISIGEKLPDSVADKWCRPGTVSLNTYGPAEATIIATYRRFQPGEKTKAQNVGLPIQTVSCAAIKDGRIVPRGAVGELALGGYQNARGYHRQADMTAKKFIEHPVAGKVYLTGDIVRFLHDGTCEFVGRNDDLVKLGGVRVELSEISAVLKSCHPLVRDAATLHLSRPDRPQKVVCTFLAAPSLPGQSNLCTDAKAAEIASAAKQYAEQYLPLVMHPTVLVVVNNLPLTPSNKVDRRALTDVYVTMDILSWETALGGISNDSGPLSDTEATIQIVVSDLTGSPIEWIKKTTPFPALGVDSLRALQLTSRLRKAGISVSVRDILTHSSTAKLARCVDQESKADRSTVPTVSRLLQAFDAIWRPRLECDIEGMERVLPCTPLQEGMLGETVKNTSAYWSHRLFKLDCTLEVDRLIRSWELVATRTEVLRVVFLPAAAHVSPDVDLDPTTVFLQAVLTLPALQVSYKHCLDRDILTEATERASVIVKTWTGSHLPPWALTIFEQNEGERTMMLSIHHALYDGNAIQYLLDEVQLAYHGRPLGDHLQLTGALSASLFAHEAQESQAFWDNALTPFADVDANPWPTLLDRSPASDEKSRFLASSFRADRTVLSQAASEVDASVSHVLQAAWSFVLSAYMGTSKVVFGETLSLRVGNASLERAIAPLITTTPVLAAVEKSTTPRALISQLARLSTHSSPHRLVSLQRIRKALQRQIHQPVFCAIFVIFTEEDEEEGSLSLTPPDKLWSGWTEVTELGVEHPLAVNVYVSGTEVKVDVLGSSKFMLDSQIDLLAGQFEAVLKAVVKEPNAPFVDLMAGLPEQYLSVIHPKQVATLGDLSLTHWLEKRAIVTPDLVAVVTYGSSTSRLTYKELDEASTRVAHWLRQSYRSSVIAFSMPRSALSIVYQLGIFKSGNIYFPIDDTVQPSRKRLLIRAGNAAVVLTSSAFCDQFSQVETLMVVDVESSEHAREVSYSAAGQVPSVIAQSVACITATGVHRTSSRLCTFSPRNINTTIEALVDRIGATVSTLGDNIFLSWMPSSLESSLVELFLPIRLGMTIASVPQDALRRDVLGTITETSATHIFLPPAWLQQEGVRKCDVPSLHCIVLIGPPLQTEVFQGEEELSQPLILTAFGFPETTSFSVVGQYQPAPTRILGHVLPHLTAVILEQGSSSLVVRGQIGELCLSGDSVSSGYLHGSNPRFCDVPKFGRVFRTGSIVRLLANDSIQYIGQAHSTLESVAKPVDPFTVSRVVQSLSPQRLNVYTSNLDHPEGLAKYLVTFISRSWDPLCADAPSICSKDLPLARSFRGLCRRLPTHLVPDVVLPLDAIPLDNCLLGTVDDRALRRLFGRLSPDVLRDRDEQGAHKRPLTAVEEQIRHILSLSTGVSEAVIDGNTSTLELGIDSLTAISLSFRLKAEGFFVPPHVILAGPTLAVLAKSSRTPHKSARRVNASSVDDTLKQRIYQDFGDRNVQDVRCCLPLQEGLVARTLNSPDAVYVNHFILRIEEANPGRLRDAFTQTVMANDILRTCFFAGDTEIVQVVLKDAPDLWRIRDAGHEDSLSLLKADMPSIEQDVVQRISQHTPIRLSLYSSHVAPTYVCLTMHHAIYDGESLPMLLSEVRDRYHQSFKTVRAPDTRLLDFLASQSRELAEAFFLEYLQDAPKPKSLLAGAVADPQRQQIVLGLPLSALEQASRVLNTSLHALLMTAYGVALGEHRGNTDSVFGVVLSGRTVLVDGVDSMLAPCITTVPIRVRVEEPQIFSDIASQTQLQTASVYEHQHTPLRIIQRWVGSAEPLFDTLFSYTKGRTVSPSHHLWSLLESQAALDYPLALAVHADADADTVTMHVGHDLKFGSVAAVGRLLSRVADLLLDMNQTVSSQIVASQSAPSVPTGPTYDSTTWSTEERLIRSTVARICKVDEALVSKETSFLHLGIDSITSIRLAQELRSEDLAVPTFAIMQNPCIGALVDFLRTTTLGSTSENALREFQDIQAALVEKYTHSASRLSDMDDIQAIFPTTPLQTGMLTQSLSGVGSLYLVHHGFLLDAKVSPQRLRRAWETVIESTDILRCSFFASADPDYPWIGAVHGHAPTQWEEITVSSEEDLRVLARDIENSVTLQDEHAFQKPPISFRLIVAPEMTVLIASIHHSLYDGLSFSYILEDVAAAYHDVEIPKRPQFTDAVPFILHSSKDETISGKPDYDIKAMGVTVQAVALLAWGKTLATLVHSLDVVFGQVVAGRSIELQDSLRASGPLFNTIPFRFKLSDSTWSNLDAVRAQHDFNVQAEPHQHVPLRRIQRDWRMATLSPESLFDTLFVFQQANDKSAQRSALWSGFTISEEALLPIIHSGETIQLRAGCQNGVFLPASLQDTLSVLREVFLNIVTAPTDSVMAYPPQLQGLGLAVSSVESIAPTYSHERAESVRTLTTTELTVRAIFSTILNLPEDKIGVETPLYALGLDSVAAIQIAAKCRNEFGLNIAVADIFVGETIAGICQAYDAHHVSTEAPATLSQANVVPDEEKLQALNLLGVTEDMVDHVLPVLPGQLYHLAAWLTCGGTFYQPVFVYKVSSIPDVDKLSLAWKTLQSRHSVLRSSFAAISPSKAFQVVFREPDVELELVECEGDFDQRVKEHVRAEYHTPSTLYTPPSRAKLLRVQDQYALLLTLHHSTYDAWSVPRLVSDLCSLYERADCKSSANFSDFVQYVHASCNRPAQADFWRSSLDGSYTSSLLPRQHESSDLKQVFVRTSGIVSSADQLHATCQAAGSSLQAVVLAVWGRIVQQLTGAESPVLGVYHTGRAESFEGLDVLAGPCVNILPLQIPSQTKLVDALNAARYIQGQLGKRTKYEQTALRDINDWVGHSGPLFNVFINLLWHGDKIRSLRTGDSLLESYSVGVPTEYTSEIPFELHTSVSALDCSYLPKTGMYVDVVLNAQTNSLGIAIKCNEVLLDESELRDVVSRFADGVRAAVEELNSRHHLDGPLLEKMAKTSKKQDKRASASLYDFFPRKSAGVSSSPAKQSPAKPGSAAKGAVKAAAFSKQSVPSPSPAAKPSRAVISETASSAGPSRAKTVADPDVESPSESDLSSPVSSPGMQIRATAPAAQILSPTKPSSKRKAKFDLDGSDDVPAQSATIYVPKSCPATPDARHAPVCSTPQNGARKRLRFSSPIDEVPDSEGEEQEQPLSAKATDIPFSARPGSPSVVQQPTPPPNVSTESTSAAPFDSPRTIRTRDLVADIKRRAAIKAKAMSSPESTPPPVFNDDLFESSSDDDAEALPVHPISKAKGKAKAIETPAGRYPLRNHTSPESQGRTRKAPARGPVILTKGRAPPVKKAVNPIDGLLREKRRADQKHIGEEARNQADIALARKHMLDEMDYDGDDDQPTSRIGVDPFGLRAPPGDEGVNSADGELLLGKKRGKAVANIIESDRRTEEVAQRQEQTFGVALWEDDSGDLFMDSDLTAPDFSVEHPMFKAFSEAIARQDTESASILLNCGMLYDDELQHDVATIGYICSLALSPAHDRLARAAYCALTNLWSAPNAGIPGLPVKAMVSTLYQLGALQNVMQFFGWDGSSDILGPSERRSEVVRFLVDLATSSARNRRTSPEDIADPLMILSLLGLDPTSSSEQTRVIIGAIDALCRCIPPEPSPVQRTICNKLLTYLRTLQPVNQAHLLSLFASGSAQTQLVARITAHSLLSDHDVVPENYDRLASLLELSAVFSSTHKTSTVFKIHDETNYVAMGFCVQIAAIALTDIDGCVRDEQRLGMGPRETTTSPRKSGDRPDTPLEELKATLERLHARIIDTRAAHLDRSRTKAALMSLTMRIRYQHQSALRSSNNRPGQKNLPQFFRPTN
ncbi:acetyl-CoA synthetase-like protein [Hymenopellis radicata]|nr:acetyl-CoA synthetase-like protein [Hymenopellis radicata]